MKKDLKREDWDFSSLSEREYLPALAWEMRRESDEEENITMMQAWLAGKLSDKKPPMPKDKRTGKRPKYNINFSEADEARLIASAAFQHFIPFGEHYSFHKGSAKNRQEIIDRWLASYIRPLVENYAKAWLCLPQPERQRLCEIMNRIKDMNVVHIGTWWDAVGTFNEQRPDPYEPLKFDYSEQTSVLVTINWRHSKKRILAAVGRVVKRLEPPGARPTVWRGKKDRDKLVMLERIAVMRLLHNYTLSEIKRRLPDAWQLYQNRKWYDDRRRALKDFRSFMHFSEPENHFPKNWKTKAQRLE